MDEKGKLHPNEEALVDLIRDIKHGHLFIKVKDNLPKTAEVAKDKIIFEKQKENK